MSLPITPHVLVAAYEYLRTTRPFSGWKLPEADEVEFGVTRHRDRAGDHEVVRRKKHIIRVSAYSVKTTGNLMGVVAHEMIHAYQDGIARNGSRRVEHNKEFYRLAKRVCHYHGWKLEEFVEGWTC
jgi:hypothetical protein